MNKKSIILAVSKNGVIGNNGTLCWKIKKDMQYFKKVTSGHTVIMGRKTFESFGGRPLPNRVNIIVTRNRNFVAPSECYVAYTIEQALTFVPVIETEVFFIGGAEIYKEAMEIADCLYITHVHAEVQGDTFFRENINPEKWNIVESEWIQADEENQYKSQMVKYERV